MTCVIRFVVSYVIFISSKSLNVIKSHCLYISDIVGSLARQGTYQSPPGEAELPAKLQPQLQSCQYHIHSVDYSGAVVVIIDTWSQSRARAANMAGNNVQQLLTALLSTDNDTRSKAEVRSNLDGILFMDFLFVALFLSLCNSYFVQNMSWVSMSPKSMICNSNLGSS